MGKVEVEVYALSDMNTALRKLAEDVVIASQEAQEAIQKESERLRSVEQQRRQELARCHTALTQCLSQIDEDGRLPPCTEEQRALERVQQDLRDVRDQIKTFVDQAESFQQRVNRFRQAMDGSLENARGYLDKHIQAGLRYLQNHPEDGGSIPGGGEHGARYQRARSEWFRRAAAGELRSEPPDLQCWMGQEVRRGGYYRSPYRGHPFGRGRPRLAAYDTGHFVAGIDIPENFRWERAAENRRRPHLARRRGLNPRFY